MVALNAADVPGTSSTPAPTAPTVARTGDRTAALGPALEPGRRAARLGPGPAVRRARPSSPSLVAVVLAVSVVVSSSSSRRRPRGRGRRPRPPRRARAGTAREAGTGRSSAQISGRPAQRTSSRPMPRTWPGLHVNRVGGGVGVALGRHRAVGVDRDDPVALDVARQRRVVEDGDVATPCRRSSPLPRPADGTRRERDGKRGGSPRTGRVDKDRRSSLCPGPPWIRMRCRAARSRSSCAHQLPSDRSMPNSAIVVVQIVEARTARASQNDADHRRERVNGNQPRLHQRLGELVVGLHRQPDAVTVRPLATYAHSRHDYPSIARG